MYPKTAREASKANTNHTVSLEKEGKELQMENELLIFSKQPKGGESPRHILRPCHGGKFLFHSQIRMHSSIQARDHTMTHRLSLMALSLSITTTSFSLTPSSLLLKNDASLRNPLLSWCFYFCPFLLEHFIYQCFTIQKTPR